MDVSFPALRMDSTKLQARGAFCRRRGWRDGGLVSGDVSRTAQDTLRVQLIGAIVRHSSSYSRLGPPPTAQHANKHLITTLRDEIRQPDQQPLRLTIPTEERLARVADALLDDVGDHRTLDAWADVAGMSRRTFMRAFSAQAGMSFGRWRQQARLFAALEMLAQRKSVTEVAIAVGYDSVSAFIEMFRAMLGTTPQAYFRAGVRDHSVEPRVPLAARIFMSSSKMTGKPEVN
jgi:AraC-like DNA-binding protein